MNIKDVAALAGVSPATVSRYLNNTGTICQQTRERIGKVVEATGYNPKQKAKRIEMNHNPTIGVLIPSLLNPVFSEIVAAIQERARYFGYSTIIVDTQYDKGREQQAVVDLIRQRVGGVILTVANTEQNEALALLKDFNFPICLLYNKSAAQEPAVFVDNFKAGWQVADKLIGLGHYRFGVAAGHFSASDRARQRYEGFKQRIEKDDRAELALLLQVDPTEMAPYSQHKDVIKAAMATAWFCSNDLLALKMINHFHQTGMKVPDEVSVVGFDGMSLGQIVHPPLATVRVPHKTMGSCAVDLLFNSKHNTDLSLQRELDFQLSLEGTVSAIDA